MRKSKADFCSDFAKILKKHIPALILVAGIWFFSRNYYQFMLIQGESMLPAYRDHQLVILDKHTRDYQQGDVIAFWCDNLKLVLVKRIMALPGSTVQILDGALLVDGEIIEGITVSDAGVAETEITVPEGCLFVLGDNLEYSIDSRHTEVGFAEVRHILGKIPH